MGIFVTQIIISTTPESDLSISNKFARCQLLRPLRRAHVFVVIRNCSSRYAPFRSQIAHSDSPSAFASFVSAIHDVKFLSGGSRRRGQCEQIVCFFNSNGRAVAEMVEASHRFEVERLARRRTLATRRHHTPYTTSSASDGCDAVRCASSSVDSRLAFDLLPSGNTYLQVAVAVEVEVADVIVFKAVAIASSSTSRPATRCSHNYWVADLWHRRGHRRSEPPSTSTAMCSAQTAVPNEKSVNGRPTCRCRREWTPQQQLSVVTTVWGVTPPTQSAPPPPPPPPHPYPPPPQPSDNQKLRDTCGHHAPYTRHSNNG
ncbi:hypothetical protein V9T40_010621 [Parthenolecanium corni]|uniref:Uncharacterized protein n=1 Tax=Parthenolecanium corni TaxID=536013 RepID=A0AAN9XYR4_9HEMI